MGRRSSALSEEQKNLFCFQKNVIQILANNNEIEKNINVVKGRGNYYSSCLKKD